MRLSNKELQRALDGLAKAHTRVFTLRAKIAEHCLEVYGVDPADLDNHDFIDGVDGGCGTSAGMTVEDFDRSMRECLDRVRPR